MKGGLVLTAGLILLSLSFLLLLGRADTTTAGTFNPEFKVTLDTTEPETPSNINIEFNVPKGDVNYAGFPGLITFIPGDWGIVPGDEIPLGTVVGTAQATATFGIMNDACKTSITLDFTFKNASLDINDTVSFADSDGNGIGDVFEDKDGNGLEDGIDKYPDVNTRIFPGLKPIRRMVATTTVGGQPVLLQYLIFEPGTKLLDIIPSDPELGYVIANIQNNTGDPEIEQAPGSITDFCSPLSAVNTYFGQAEDGTPLLVNPKDGKYTFTSMAMALGDADNDGYENWLDTCPFDPNEGDPRIAGSGDADQDGLDAACDPDDNDPNSDEDNDGYQNRQDNCPLDPNGIDQDNQADRDLDYIGDACDPNPDTPDGESTLAQITNEVIIGTGTGPGGPPEGFGPAAAEEEEGEGLGTGAIIGIIVGVIAAVVVVGGGAAYFMRRRGV